DFGAHDAPLAHVVAQRAALLPRIAEAAAVFGRERRFVPELEQHQIAHWLRADVELAGRQQQTRELGPTGGERSRHVGGLTVSAEQTLRSDAFGGPTKARGGRSRGGRKRSGRGSGNGSGGGGGRRRMFASLGCGGATARDERER